MTEPEALALTLLIELPVWVLLLQARLSVPLTSGAVVGVTVNVVSHPLLWFVLIPLGEATIGSTVVAVIIGEAVVVLLEAALGTALVALLHPHPSPRRERELLMIATLANVLSVAAGLLLQAAGVGSAN